MLLFTHVQNTSSAHKSPTFIYIYKQDRSFIHSADLNAFDSRFLRSVHYNTKESILTIIISKTTWLKLANILRDEKAKCFKCYKLS